MAGFGSDLTSFNWWYWAAGSFLLVGTANGVLDAILSPTVPKNDGNPDARSLVLHVGGFVAVQLIVAPLLIIGMALVLAINGVFYGL